MGKLRCNTFGCSAQRHTVVTAKPQCNPICLASPPTRSLLSHLWLSSLAALDLGLPPFACSVPSSPASGISTRALSSGTEDVTTTGLEEWAAAAFPGLGKDTRKHTRKAGTFSVALKLYHTGI